MSVTAKVTVTLEVGMTQRWGDETSVKQVKDQAVTDADRLLRLALEDTSIKVTGIVNCTSILFLKD